MKILVDADACPVKQQIIDCAKKNNLSVYMITDITHMLSYPNEPLVHVITVDKGADSADLVLANRTETGDICVTGDYGLASLLLGKKAIVLHPNGFQYTLENIDQMLFERHLSREMRRQKKGRGVHIPKRTKEADEAFLAKLESIIESHSQ